MKKKLLFLMCSLMLLTGCKSNLKVYTEEEFEEVFKDDYTVYSNDELSSFLEDDNVDITSAIDGISSITTAGEYDHFLIFYVFDDEDTANEFFDADKESILEHDENGAIRKEDSGVNYNKYELTAGGNYYYVIKVKNTLIYSEVEEENKSYIQEMIEKLGY